MDTEELAKVLSLLKKEGVSHFNGLGLDLKFHVEQQVHAPSQIIEDKAAEESMPPDLRTDAINSADSILHWSAPPSANETPLPLTGDEPL